jgi:hypothetical protein
VDDAAAASLGRGRVAECRHHVADYRGRSELDERPTSLRSTTVWPTGVISAPPE